MSEVYFFAPHQDDELTNLGTEVLRALANGDNVHAVLCTDGGASSVKRMLQNGGCCRWHAGAHTFCLSPAAFVAARDVEFYESCLALGVPRQNIAISPLRAPDGALTAGTALAIMRAAVAGNPPGDVRAVTIAPQPEYGQNPDHTAVGEAAKALYAAGGCAAVTLVPEFILPHMESAAEPAPLAPAQFERIKKAAAAYMRWAPEEGRYAVGYHSVADEFNAFLQQTQKRVIPKA